MRWRTYDRIVARSRDNEAIADRHTFALVTRTLFSRRPSPPTSMVDAGSPIFSAPRRQSETRKTSRAS
jgi:hypothetical protein